MDPPVEQATRGLDRIFLRSLALECERLAEQRARAKSFFHAQRQAVVVSISNHAHSKWFAPRQTGRTPPGAGESNDRHVLQQFPPCPPDHD
jgi:hypothetical protein